MSYDDYPEDSLYKEIGFGLLAITVIIGYSILLFILTPFVLLSELWDVTFK